MLSSSSFIESKFRTAGCGATAGSGVGGTTGGIGSRIRVPHVSQNFESSLLGCLSGHSFIGYSFPWSSYGLTVVAVTTVVVVIGGRVVASGGNVVVATDVVGLSNSRN